MNEKTKTLYLECKNSSLKVGALDIIRTIEESSSKCKNKRYATSTPYSVIDMLNEITERDLIPKSSSESNPIVIKFASNLGLFFSSLYLFSDELVSKLENAENLETKIKKLKERL